MSCVSNVKCCGVGMPSCIVNVRSLVCINTSWSVDEVRKMILMRNDRNLWNAFEITENIFLPLAEPFQYMMHCNTTCCQFAICWKKFKVLFLNFKVVLKKDKDIPFLFQNMFIGWTFTLVASLANCVIVTLSIKEGERWQLPNSFY